MQNLKTTGWIALSAGVLCLASVPFLAGSDDEAASAAPAAPAALARTTPAPSRPPASVARPARTAPTTPKPDPSKDVVRPPAPKPPEPVRTTPAPAPAPKPAPVVEKIQPGAVYTVRSGDSLPSIAKRAYGDANRWHDVYLANLEVVADPNFLRPGWVLRIPR